MLLILATYGYKAIGASIGGLQDYLGVTNWIDM